MLEGTCKTEARVVLPVGKFLTDSVNTQGTPRIPPGVPSLGISLGCGVGFFWSFDQPVKNLLACHFIISCTIVGTYIYLCVWRNKDFSHIYLFRSFRYNSIGANALEPSILPQQDQELHHRVTTSILFYTNSGGFLHYLLFFGQMLA